MIAHRNLMSVATALVLASTGCSSEIRSPDLGTLYSRAAQQAEIHRNPVIVIPGITGSRLIEPESGRVVWGAFTGDYVNPRNPEDARLLALPMHNGKTLAELRDEVECNGVLDRVRLSVFGVPLEVRAYAQVLAILGAGGYRDESLGKSGAVEYPEGHFTCFQFDYDWRRDNVENARRLHDFIEEKRTYVQAERQRRDGESHSDVKFDIVAHSMGGLIARYYLMYGTQDLPTTGSAPIPDWPGAAHVERVILVGTPNAGSVKALTQLVNGVELAPLLPRIEPALIGTFPSVFQLLPRTRHRAVVSRSTPNSPIDVFDAENWEQLEWGLASPEQMGELRRLLPNAANDTERQVIAMDHLAKCLRRARLFHEALDVTSIPPPGLQLYLIAGDAEPTDAVVAVEEQTGHIRLISQMPGDGTVLRSSALLDERVGRGWTPQLTSPIDWQGVQFMYGNHLAMTKNAHFADNVLYLLLESPRRPGTYDEPIATGTLEPAQP